VNKSAEENLSVTLLGTGTPSPVISRFGPSTLVEAGGERFLFDAGRGAMQRIFQIGIRFVENLFLTHLHSDHVVGLPDLWLTGWVLGRAAPLRVHGPIGTKKMMSHLQEAFEFDIDIRTHYPREGATVISEDFSEGVIYEKNGVKITAFEVDHGWVKPAFGCRIDFAGRSVVLSGDTSFSENLIRYAQGTDVLILNVVVPELFRSVSLHTPEQIEKIIPLHATPEQAGEIFARVKPKLAVYSHISPSNATADDLIGPTRKKYSGPLEVGEDLMTVKVGEKVEVHLFGP
jgi:ribonuclease Z